jgi:hypothetical protein
MKRSCSSWPWQGWPYRAGRVFSDQAECPNPNDQSNLKERSLIGHSCLIIDGHCGFAIAASHEAASHASPAHENGNVNPHTAMDLTMPASAEARGGGLRGCREREIPLA